MTHCRMEDVECLNGCLSGLLVAKHQVNPRVEVLGHELTLQCLGVGGRLLLEQTTTFHSRSRIDSNTPYVRTCTSNVSTI